MGWVSSDDTHLLPAGKKIVRHYTSGISACSQYNEHKNTSTPSLDAGGGGLDSMFITTKAVHRRDVRRVEISAADGFGCQCQTFRFQVRGGFFLSDNYFFFATSISASVSPHFWAIW
jgi:hypothetical protein